MNNQPLQSNQGANSIIYAEIQVLEKKLASATQLPLELITRATAMLTRLKQIVMMGNYSSEFESVSEYINWITRLPFGNYTSDNLDLENAMSTMQQNHYGLQPVKDRIIEYLAVLKLQQQNAARLEENSSASDQSSADLSKQMQTLRGNSANAPILCFVGIQGVGKTTMAKSIANALGRGFMRIGLGGMSNVSELRGKSKSEEEAEPGQIIKALIRTEYMNPLILLDEIDKVSGNKALLSDIMASLLEILDPEQNSSFIDKYLDHPVNLSQCLFIVTANNLGGISAALLDRLEVIRFGSYTDEDKIQIARNYLLPKVRKATGIGPDQLDFAEDAWPMVVRPLGFDAGVRQLERTLTDLARKVALLIVQGKADKIVVSKDNFRQFIPEKIGVYS